MKRSALVVASAGAFLVPFMGSSVNVALPFIGADFGASAVLLGWVTTSFLLASATLLLPVGRLSDLLGRRRIFLWGVMVYGLASLGAGLAPSALFLVVARMAQGMGGAMMFGTNAAILVSVFPPQERGRVLGINTAAVYVGLSMGPFVGGLMTQAFGWRSIFLMNVPVCLFLAWLMVTRLRGEWAGSRGEPFDWEGALLYAVSLVALIYGSTRLLLPGGLSTALAGLAGLLVFLAWEYRSAYPILNVRLFSGNRPFLFSNASALLNYCATAGSMFMLSLYLQYVRGFSPRGAGMVLLVQPVVQALISPWAGRLSDRSEPRFVASLGMALTALGLFTLAWLTEETPLVLVVGGLALLGTGFGLFSSPNTNAIMSSVDRAHLGVANAMAGTMRMSGQMMSMALVMVVMSIILGGAQVTPALHVPFMKSLRLSYSLLAGLCFSGVFLSMARGNLDRPGRGGGAPVV
jgi:EmrB/QacA subfamily drug resistance transporter